MTEQQNHNSFLSMDLPSLKEIIVQYGLLKDKGFSKKLGQNFLLDENIPKRILSFVGDLSHCSVIEVGPGPGGLTRAILRQNPNKLFALERDRNCIAALQSLILASNGKLDIINIDALDAIPQDLILDGPIQIIANLPYNVGTPLLIKWLHNTDRLEALTLMFQKEVAKRIIAAPNTSDFGRLSILCQFLCNTRILMDLPPSVFTPPPKVYSSVVQLKPKLLSNTDKDLIPTLEKLTQEAFSKRRKMIRASLGTTMGSDKFKRALDVTNTLETQRPETLTVDQFVTFARIMYEQ